MSTPDHQYTHIPASQLKAGMFIDLENDPFATAIPEGLAERDRKDYELTTSTFEFEYAIVDNVVQESPDTTVVNCENTAFACPPYHRVKVATHAWLEPNGATHHTEQDDAGHAEFMAAFDIGNTADNN